jgi:hypothetical protein
MRGWRRSGGRRVITKTEVHRAAAEQQNARYRVLELLPRQPSFAIVLGYNVKIGL